MIDFTKLTSSLSLPFLSVLFGIIGVTPPIADGADFSFSCPGIGFFGDESDCRLYYICTGIGKVGSPMKCDGDLAWNQKRLACEWKRNLPADICDKKGKPAEGEKEIDSDSEVEVFDPFLSTPTQNPHKFSTTKRFGVASSRTSLPPPTTSRLGNLTEDNGEEMAQKLLLGLSEAWQMCKIFVSLAVLTLF